MNLGWLLNQSLYLRKGITERKHVETVNAKIEMVANRFGKIKFFIGKGRFTC